MTDFAHPPDLLKRTIPLLTALLAILLDVTPIQSAAPVAVAPVTTLAVIFYWSTHRPDLLGIFSVFVLGLLFDAIAGLPLGLTALSILLTYGLLWPRRQLLNGHGFLVTWACFSLVCFVVLTLRWSIACLWWGRIFDIDYALVEILLTMVLYPPVTWILAQCQPILTKVPLASGS